MRRLKLGFSGVSAADLKALSALPNVEKLGLEECPRIDDAAAAVIEAGSQAYLDRYMPKVDKITTATIVAAPKPEAKSDDKK